MIARSELRVILHCDRCNNPFEDSETEAITLWRTVEGIERTFAEAEPDDVDGWLCLNGRYLCPDCQIVNEHGNKAEADPLPAIDAIVILRAQALVDEGMLSPLDPSQVRAWVARQPASPLRDALTAGLTAAFAEDLKNWGPAPGSKAEGEYERALSVFACVEDALRPTIAADVMERAVSEQEAS